MKRKQTRGQQKQKRQQKKSPNFKTAIETVKRDYASVSSKLRNNDKKAIVKADRAYQHIKSLYDDPKLPSEFEVQVTDLYEKIKNDIEALDFVKKLGTTVKTDEQTKHENDLAHQTWIKITSNRKQRQKTKLGPLLSALQRAKEMKTNSKSSIRNLRKRKRISDIGKKQNAGSLKKKKRKSKVSRLKKAKSTLISNSAKKRTRSTSPSTRALQVANRNMLDVWSFQIEDDLNTTSVRARRKRTNIGKKVQVRSFQIEDDLHTTSVRARRKRTNIDKKIQVKSNQIDGQKIATRKTLRRPTPNEGGKNGRKNVAKNKQPQRETRDERRQRKQKEVIEQASVFDFADVKDPYA